MVQPIPPAEPFRHQSVSQGSLCRICLDILLLIPVPGFNNDRQIHSLRPWLQSPGKRIQRGKTKECELKCEFNNVNSCCLSLDFYSQRKRYSMRASVCVSEVEWGMEGVKDAVWALLQLQPMLSISTTQARTSICLTYSLACPSESLWASDTLLYFYSLPHLHFVLDLTINEKNNEQISF